ncbi:MAG: inositol-3-phosphate synthase [Bacteroidaceae bacterium]|nr:inositol-3-phosphate synthase [Bacteroidaceae bacterium]
MKENRVKPSNGKLGVMCVGLGAVTTTTIAGVLMSRKGLSKPIGSFACEGIMRLGKGSDKIYKEVKHILPIAPLHDIVFGAWDIYEDNGYEAAVKANVLRSSDIDPIKDELTQIQPYKALFDKSYATNIDGPNVKEPATRWEQTEELRKDIRHFKEANNCDRVVVIWIASTEKYIPRDEKVHGSLSSFEAAMKADDKEHIAPSMCYAYAAMREGCPFVMGAPNLCIDIPAMWELANETKMPISGKDFKSGQTMMKTVLAPAFFTRQLGVTGWFSTNILGNRDGIVLDAPENFETKRRSKMSAVENILDSDIYPQLYSNIYHKVRINYYPPRGDEKESWDNIDIFGWMGYPMTIKVNFLCRDSILAAPIALDLILFSDIALRSGLYGIQEFLSFYCKAPMHADNEKPVHDLFKQFAMLKNKIRELAGYEADQELD